MAKSRKHHHSRKAMSKRHKRHARHSRKSRRHHRRLRGGDSAWQYEMATVGNMNQQIQNSLVSQPGDNVVSANSTQSVPVNNLNANTLQGMPTAAQMKLIQSGGRRRRHHKKSVGGSISSIVSTALAPLALLGLQQTFGKTRKSRKSRK